MADTFIGFGMKKPAYMALVFSISLLFFCFSSFPNNYVHSLLSILI